MATQIKSPIHSTSKNPVSRLRAARKMAQHKKHCDFCCKNSNETSEDGAVPSAGTSTREIAVDAWKKYRASSKEKVIGFLRSWQRRGGIPWPTKFPKTITIFEELDPEFPALERVHCNTAAPPFPAWSSSDSASETYIASSESSWGYYDEDDDVSREPAEEEEDKQGHVARWFRLLDHYEAEARRNAIRRKLNKAWSSAGSGTGRRTESFGNSLREARMFL